MKSLAQGYVWCPGMDEEIERIVKCCQLCQESSKAPAKASLHTWKWLERAWFRVYGDYASPF